MKTDRIPQGPVNPQPVYTDIDASLAQLEQAQLVRRTDDPDPAYLFKHTLTQETAYQSLLLKTRRDIHRRVAQSIEQLDGEHLDENAAMLAQHYTEAQEPVKALEYETRAGDVAARRYANAEALEHYSRALALAGPATTPETIRELYLRRGRTLELSGSYSEALGNYDEMEAFALAHADRESELSSLLARATLRATPTPVFDADQAQSLLDRALARARERDDHAAESKGLWNLMLLSKFTSHPREAVEYGEQSLRIARDYNLREQMAFTLNDLAVHAYLDVGQFRRGLESAAEARVLWKELDNQPMLADSWGTTATLDSVFGQLTESLQAAEEGQRISDRIGNMWGQSYSRFAEGEVRVERGEMAQGIATMEECIRLGKQAGFIAPLVWVRSNLAVAYAELGAVDHGIELARQALATSETELPIWRPLTLGVLASLELTKGEGGRAETRLRDAHLDADLDSVRGGLIVVVNAVALAHARIAIARGDRVAALAILGDLIAQLLEIDAKVCLPFALLLRARLSRLAGEEQAAREDLEQARAVAEQIGSRRHLWQVLAELSEMEAEIGHDDQAHSLKSRAREIVEYIVDHTPPELRETFLRRSEVQAVLQSAPVAAKDDARADA